MKRTFKNYTFAALALVMTSACTAPIDFESRPDEALVSAGCDAIRARAVAAAKNRAQATALSAIPFVGMIAVAGTDMGEETRLRRYARHCFS